MYHTEEKYESMQINSYATHVSCCLCGVNVQSLRGAACATYSLWLWFLNTFQLLRSWSWAPQAQINSFLPQAASTRSDDLSREGLLFITPHITAL